MKKSLRNTLKKCLPDSLLQIILSNSTLLLLLLFLAGCGKSVLDQETTSLNRSLPDETSNNVSIYAYKENRVDYILTADKIERFYNTRQLNAWKVRIVTYDGQNKVKGTISADTTYVDEARNLIKAMGNVIFISPNGTIKSRLINWDRNADEIYTPEKVMLIRDDKTLYGDNLRTNSSISFAEMNTVSAEGKIKGDEIDW
jgi:LPS export ABC transporter protein LptC